VSDAVAGRSVAQRLVRGRTASALAALLTGVVAGCWVAYVLVYPVSSLPLPKYTLAGVVVLGYYLDYFAESMLGRLLTVFVASGVAYVVGFAGYAFPALVGWYTDPGVQRSIYLSGLRRAFLFSLMAMTLLLAGTFISYILRNSYAELTR
jgi:hypothetical protein